MMDFSIIPASKPHADILSSIHQECFPNYWNIEEFNNFFAVGDTHALMVESGGKPVGMMVWRISHEQADIMTIAVLPAFRRQGVAGALLARALEHMAQAGVATLFLDVEDGNEAAVRLYETHGFSHIRRRKLYYRQKDGSCTDALVMSKKLA